MGQYVTVDTEEGVRRGEGTAKKTGRLVPPAAIRAIHQSVSNVLPALIANDEFDYAEAVGQQRVPAGADRGEAARAGRGRSTTRRRGSGFVAKGAIPVGDATIADVAVNPGPAPLRRGGRFEDAGGG